MPHFRVATVLTAGIFAAYLIALSPHFVHHLLDENGGGAGCPFLAQSQQTPDVQSDPPSLAPPIQIATVHVLSPVASLPAPGLALLRPRAPPGPTPSV